jgi:hypothetical protein
MERENPAAFALLSEGFAARLGAAKQTELKALLEELS